MTSRTRSRCRQLFFFFQAEDGIRDRNVTGVQTCALPIFRAWEQVMFDDLATTPDVASVCFGNPNGDATYLQRAHGRLELGIADGSRDCAAIEWHAFADGSVDRQQPLRTYR